MGLNTSPPGKGGSRQSEPRRIKHPRPSKFSSPDWIQTTIFHEKTGQSGPIVPRLAHTRLKRSLAHDRQPKREATRATTLTPGVKGSRAAWRHWIRRRPADGTKRTHGPERDLFKTCVLGVQYGMGAASLAGRIGKPSPYAVELLRLHRQTYPRFWAWSEGVESHAMLLNRLHTVFGWTVRVGSDANSRSLRNFPCQANGAEMLRLACCLALERGVSVMAPIHDAVIVEGP